MKHIGHTLFNDLEYGGDAVLRGAKYNKYVHFVENCFALIPGQALHAKSLGFKHPTTKEWMQFDSDLPEGFAQIIHKWETYVLEK
jgi:23S rRNA pseudouridine1911/1915/1917 synthase